MRSLVLGAFAFLGWGLLAPTMSFAQIVPPAAVDEVVFSRVQGISRAPLPRGPHGDVTPLDFTPMAVVATTDLQVYAIALDPMDGLYDLYRLDGVDGGSPTLLGSLPLLANEQFSDLAAGTSGKFWVLTQTTHPLIPILVPYLREIDPTAVPAPLVVQERFTSRDFDHLAATQDGLLGLSHNQVFAVDPETGESLETGLELDSGYITLGADSDSTGAVWLLQEQLLVSPPSYRLARLDPVNGTIRRTMLPIDFQPTDLTILRRCQQTATTRCLMGGRFAVTATWRDFEGEVGDGQVVPQGSADSALFWFFDPANWEVLVKIVDGCSSNGHFWIYAAGTTDVEYHLTVQDLLTGQTFETTNPLGQASSAVTATQAFATCEGDA